MVIGCTMIDMHVKTKIDQRFRVSKAGRAYVELTKWKFIALVGSSVRLGQWIDRRDSVKWAGEMSSEKLAADWAPPDDCRLNCWALGLSRLLLAALFLWAALLLCCWACSTGVCAKCLLGRLLPKSELPQLPPPPPKRLTEPKADSLCWLLEASGPAGAWSVWAECLWPWCG